MNNAKQIWQETTKELQKVYDRREAENIAYVLLEDLFEIKQGDVLMGEGISIDQDLLSKCLMRLLEHEPIQYVTGWADFFGRKFKIQPGALIPRPETEELCELIIKNNVLEKPRILDVGTGSGCIAITLAVETKGVVFGIDISDDALKTARANASLLNASVRFERDDMLKEKFPFVNMDILVSNPPYIPASDKVNMHKNVLMYEPDSALFVPDSDPLLFYRVIAEKGIDTLKKGGKLYFEIHERYGKELCKLLEKIGYSNIVVYEDMQGKDRMVGAIKA
ncbi:MAG: peptide chain release factor N(5)-glutamine methyltransferase [Bacteroidota bacterium]